MMTPSKVPPRSPIKYDNQTSQGHLGSSLEHGPPLKPRSPINLAPPLASNGLHLNASLPWTCSPVMNSGEPLTINAPLTCPLRSPLLPNDGSETPSTGPVMAVVRSLKHSPRGCYYDVNDYDYIEMSASR